jgi:hypothetical protein
MEIFFFNNEEKVMKVTDYEVNRSLFLIVATVGNLNFRQLQELWLKEVNKSYKDYKDAIKMSLELRSRIRHNKYV